LVQTPRQSRFRHAAGPTAYLPVEGTYYLRANGTAEKPIVIKAAGDGEVISTVAATSTFLMSKGDYTYFEGITFRIPNSNSGGRSISRRGDGLTVKALPVRGHKPGHTSFLGRGLYDHG